MAIYRVLLDGIDIYDPTSKGMVLIDPVVHTEAGAAGNFEFTMPPMHVFYNNITPYGSSIEVLEDGQSIFFGRPLKPKIGFYNQKTYHCEGALAFLNDSRPTDEFVYENTTPAQYFRDLIAYHNSLQSKQSRKFTVGNITVSTDWDVYREMSPSMTIMEHIKRGCVGSDGGYLFTRRVNGVTYIDWMKDMPYTCNQTVEFSLNLLDMSRSGNEDIYTGVMLKGGERKIKINGRVLNSVVKHGPMWGSAEAIAKYGEIMAYQEYPDIDNVDNLIAAGEYFLMTQQFESMLFEVSAAEQHYLNVSLDAFEAGQKVHLVSNPHFVDIELPVQSIEVRLDSAEKKVTLGTVKRQTLTKIQRKMKEEQENNILDIDRITGAVGDVETNVDDMQSNIDDLFENQGIVMGDDGYPYTLGVDPSGNVYAQIYDPIPAEIDFIEAKAFYRVGETYDGTLNKVVAFYATTPDAEGEDITDKCAYSIEHWQDGQLVESSADGFTFEEATDTYNLVAKYTVRGTTKVAKFGVSCLPEGYYAWGEAYVTDDEYFPNWRDVEEWRIIGDYIGIPDGRMYSFLRQNVSGERWGITVYGKTPTYIHGYSVLACRGYEADMTTIATTTAYTYRLNGNTPYLERTDQVSFSSYGTTALTGNSRIRPVWRE